MSVRSKYRSFATFSPICPTVFIWCRTSPVAGTEYSGPESGFAELFENRYCILTPPDGVDQNAVEKIQQLWKAANSIVELMDADHHDRVLAITSHLPHLIAYTIVGTANDLEGQLREKKAEGKKLNKTADVIKYSAGGFP